MNPAATGLEVGRPAAATDLSPVEQQIADIFDLDPQEFGERLRAATDVPRAGANSEVSSPSVAEPQRPGAAKEAPRSAAAIAPEGHSSGSQGSVFEEQRVASEPGSFERDFWEEVSALEERLTGAGARGAEAAQTAIAMAAAQFSLQQSEEPSAGLKDAGQGLAAHGSQTSSINAVSNAEAAATPQAAPAADGAAALVGTRMQLENRAQKAISVSQSLRGSALRAAAPGKG